MDEPLRGHGVSATSAVAERSNGRAPKFSIADIPSIWSYHVSVTWLIEDLIPEGCITPLSGDSGAGKSTLALALAGAVAHGAPFLGLATSHRAVLYVDRENPLAVVKERLHRLRIPETDWLRYWGLWVDPYPTGPGDAVIMRFVRDHRPLIIFDSLVAFHSGSEQDASETRAHMQTIQAFGDSRRHAAAVAPHWQERERAPISRVQ